MRNCNRSILSGHPDAGPDSRTADPGTRVVFLLSLVFLLFFPITPLACADNPGNETLSIINITPAGAESGSLITVTVTGSGFEEGLTAELRSFRPVALPAEDVQYISGNSFLCTFDLAAAQCGYYTLAITNPDLNQTMLNRSFSVYNTTPVLPPELKHILPVNAKSACVSDLDGDGVNELIVGTYASEGYDQVLLYRYSGNGYQLLWSYDIPESGILGAVTALAAGDTDNDGRKEIVVSTGMFSGGGYAEDRNLRIFKRPASDLGSWELNYTYGIGELTTPLSLSIGDADNDGLNELIVGMSFYSRSILQFESSGSTYSVSTIESTGSDVNSVAIHDLDGDGRNELIVGTGCWSMYNVGILEKTGEVWARVWDSPAYGWSQAIAGDFNADGLEEIIAAQASGECGSNNPGYLRIYQNNTEIWNYDSTSEYYLEGGSPAIGDLNGDGVSEITTITRNTTTQVLRIFSPNNPQLNPGLLQHNIVFPWASIEGITNPDSMAWSCAVIGDSDNNGVNEILLCALYDGTLKIYECSDAPPDKEIFSLSPDSAGNSPDVAIAIRGSGFVRECLVDLRSGGDVIATSQQITCPSSGVLHASFDLSSTTPGTYNLTVRWPDDTERSIPFSIYEEGTWVYLGDLDQARMFMAGCYDSTHQQGVVFGGESSPGGTVLSSTVIWNGENWTGIPATGPGGRENPGMAFDRDLGIVVMYGGWTLPDNYYSDVWSWDGGAWTLLGDGPGTRANHAMAYDSDRKKIVVFGGSNPGILGDTWEFDGVSWTEITTTESPSARVFPGMAYDQSREKMVLFGGESTYGGTLQGDTWEYDGSSWSRIATTGPSPRSFPSMSYDPNRQRVVLFGGGGYNGEGLAGDTWEWDGVSWLEINTTGATPRRGAGTFYDETLKSVILFGGMDSIEGFSDTLQLVRPGDVVDSSITKAYPQSLKNSSSAYLTIYGRNFTSPMNVDLKRQNVTVASAESVIVATSSTLITAFDLTPVRDDTYDLAVTWPDGTRKMKLAAVSVSALPKGVLYQDTEMSLGAGQTIQYLFDVPQGSSDLFILLQKSTFPIDGHWSWTSEMTLTHTGNVTSTSISNQDPLIQVKDPEPGPYILTVKADEGGEGILTISTSLPELSPGDWIPDTIHRPFGSSFHQVNIPGGLDELTIEAETMNDFSFFRVYTDVYEGSPRWITAYGETEVTIPDPDAGRYIVEFVDPQVLNMEDQTRDILLRARTEQGTEPPPTYTPVISGYLPQAGGNTGTVTIEIKGGWLDPNSTVYLSVDGTGNVPASSVEGTPDRRTLAATMDLDGVAPGSYALVVQHPDGTVLQAPSRFLVEEGGRSEFWTELNGMEKIRIGRPAKYILNYGNSGNLDMPAPLVAIAANPPSSQVSMRILPEGTWNTVGEDGLVFRCNGSEENPGILPAGSSFTMEFQVKTDFTEEFTLELVPYGGDPIYSPRVLESVIDISVPAPGMPLTFGRKYPATFSSYSGPLGTGWVHSYDYRLVPFEDGNLGLKAGDTFDTTFSIQPDGSWMSLDGTLVAVQNPSGGGYTLTAKDGSFVQFDSSGCPLSLADSNGNTVTLSYSGEKLIGIQHSDGDSLVLAYDGNNRIASVSGPAGRIVSYSYTADGKLLEEVAYEDSTVIRYSYRQDNSGSAIVTITRPGNLIENYGYDGDGRLSGSSKNGEKENIAIRYHDIGRATTITDAAGTAIMVRVDERGKVVRKENALGSIRVFSYDANGSLTQTEDSAGNRYHFEWNDGKVTSKKDPLDYVTRFTYHPDFSMIENITDPRGNILGFDYDSHANVVGILYPDNRRESISYDSAGNLVSYTTGKGDLFQYNYNTRGQLTWIGYPDGKTATYAYDAAGNLVEAASSTGTISIAYNDRHEMTRVSYPGDVSFNYTYDDAGRLIEREDRDGQKITYMYNDVGHLISVGDGSGTEFSHYTYDSAGRLVQKTVGSGAYTTYQYDDAGRISRLVNYGKTGSYLSLFEYQYDEIGNPVRIGTLDGNFTYTYDALGQLTSVTFPEGTNTQYSYDPAGNRLSTSANGITTGYSTNAMNQYTQVGTVSFSYDNNGNTISRTENGTTTNYEFNYENRLTRVTSPGEIREYGYDALGNCITVSCNGIETRYAVDPFGSGNIAAEYSANGTLKSKYVYGLGLVAKVDSDEEEFYYHFTPAGHTSEITDEAGSVINRYQYTPFGEYRQNTEEITNPFTYVGEYGVIDEGNTLLRMGMRYYSPDTGRFIQEDPIGIEGGLNLYTYANNNPITGIDPSGLHPDWERRPVTDEDIGYLIPTPFPSVPPDELCDEDGYARHQGPVIKERNTKNEQRNENEVKKRQAIEDKVHPGGYRSDSRKTPFEHQPGFVTPQEAFSRNSGQSVTQSITPTSSVDPEDKYGPAGYDPSGTPSASRNRYVNPANAMNYRIDFWNHENATANVCDVDAYDQMDADLNWSTFQFTGVGFTDWSIPLEPTKYFDIYVDTRPQMNYIVHITGMFNPETGNATLEYHTLDPATYDTPEDPQAGFLPPISDSGAEVGWFTYTITSEPGLPTGTLIEDRAFVNFDYSQHLPAPKDAPWKNTVDSGKPSSSLAASLEGAHEIRFTAALSDDSGGSGVKDYTIYLSDNNGPFTPWLNRVTGTAQNLTGVAGHTYQFYSIARDHVGNTEDAPASPDGSIAVPAAESKAEPPFVTSIMPSSGNLGRTIRITDLGGNCFLPGAGVNLTRGASAILASDVNVTSASRITCNLTIPPGIATGSWNVTVTNPDGQSGTLVNGFQISGSTLPWAAVFRPSSGNNWIFTRDLVQVDHRDHYGVATDIPLFGDFNHDGATDRAVFRNGDWIVDHSMDGSVNARDHFGLPTDIPLAGYFDGDGRMDRGVFRSGQWIVDLDLDGDVDSRTSYGVAGDIPLVGDFNHDGVPDRAVFRNGQWILDLSMNGSVDLRSLYGVKGDLPAIADFNGDGVMDRAVFRKGEWIIDYTMDGSVDSRLRFGTAGDRPLAWNGG